jgi:NADPH:quinone reductase-like Zn-dependent oxidoreductase
MYSTTQTVPGTMKAMVYDKAGSNRMAWHSDMKVPSPGVNEVLVRVASASMNPVDYRLTDNRGYMHPTPKRIVGCDFAGTIVGLGREVRGFTIGDQVFGWGSGYANYATANVFEIAKVPPGFSADDMGIYGLVGTCAHQILRTHWLEKPNFNVRNMLVIGASGGVGSSVVQIARAYGGPELRIHAVTSMKNTDYVKQLGANEVVDYTVRDFDIARAFPIHSMDLIVDTVSGTPESSEYFHSGGKLLLKPHGKYVSLNSLSGLDWYRKSLTRFFGLNMQRAHYDLFITQRKKSDVDLQAVARLVQQRKYHLNIAQQIPLLETPIRRALHELRLRHIRGKVKIRPTEYGAAEHPPFESPTAGTREELAEGVSTT